MIGDRTAATRPHPAPEAPGAPARQPPVPVLDPVTGVLSAPAWAARARAVLSGHLPGGHPPVDAAGWAVLAVGIGRDGAATVRGSRSRRPLDRAVLAGAARALVAAAGPRALVGRLDGDGFVVLADAGDPTVARSVARTLRCAVAALHDRAGVPLGATASVGAALLPARPRPAEVTAAFWAADAALYDAARHDAGHAGPDPVRVT